MKIIWVFENIYKKEDSYSRMNILLMLASVRLWKKHHPEDTTYLYCDIITYSLLEKLEVLSLYDKVEIIDFEEKVNKEHFWASSKLKVLSLQTEPVIIMDCDTLVFKPFKQYLESDTVMYTNKEHGRGYYPTSIDPYVRKLSYKARWKTDSVNVSFLHLPDPKFTQEYANLSLQLMREFTELGVPNSKYLIFAEQLLLKHLLDKNKVKHKAVIKSEWDCNNWRWSEIETDGLWNIKESWSHFRHYGPLKKWYKKDDPDHSYKEEMEMLRNCINFHKLIDLSYITNP